MIVKWKGILLVVVVNFKDTLIYLYPIFFSLNKHFTNQILLCILKLTKYTSF